MVTARSSIETIVTCSSTTSTVVTAPESTTTVVCSLLNGLPHHEHQPVQTQGLEQPRRQSDERHSDEHPFPNQRKSQHQL
jgi:hypothetical protein